MNHHLTGLMCVKPFKRNDTKFPKTLSVNDFYHGIPNDADARGNIQMLGNKKGEMIRSAYTSVHKFLAKWLGRHSVDILVMSEDLPNSESRVRLLENGAVKVEYKPGG